MTATSTTEAATDSPPPTRRLRRWLWPGLVALALVGAAVLSLVAQRPVSTLPLHPDNPRPGGARAAAEILRREGVHVTVVRTTRAAAEAAADGGTLLVTDAGLLGPEQWATLGELPVDLVVTNLAYADLAPLTPSVGSTGSGGDGVRAADCADPAARAAGTLATGSGDVRALEPGVVVCFPAPGSPEAGTGALAVVVEDGRRRAFLGNPRPLTNDALDEAGNAALVLHLLGAHEALTWYVPSLADVGSPSAPEGSVLPPWAGAVAAWAVLVLVAAMVWRGRRLGPVVVEPLPVVVRPAETTLGRARLYRRAGAHAHAAAALRAGAATRLARRLGVSPAATPEALVVAVARAAGRAEADVAALLYGPDPEDDAALRSLIGALDSLEHEVDHP